MIPRMPFHRIGPLLLPLLIGCSASRGWSVSAPAKSAPQSSAAVRTESPAPDRDMLLFGQADPQREVRFEGKASSNLQQHTFSVEGAEYDPAIDPNGRKLVFASTRNSRHSHLYMKPIDGASITQITDGPANDAQPAFSPDGRRLAFASDRSGQWDIWVIDLDGRHPMQVTDNPAAELHPSWSPDGKRLVFCRIQPRGAGGELWIADLDTPGVQRFIGEGLFPAWSPTGERIAYQRARQRGSRWFSIWTLTLKDNEPTMPTEVASSPHSALIAPAWSPDGGQLAFACVSPARRTDTVAAAPSLDAGGQTDIGIVDADGRGLIRLTEGGGDRYSPCWAADDRIYFTTKLDDTETIWSVRPFRFPRPDMGPPLLENRRAAEASHLDEEP